MEDLGFKDIRVRFAPSPTGKLHLGSARTALFNWLVARGGGGRLVLRLEDTDEERSSIDFEENILDSLKWIGIDWDEGPDIGGDYGPYRQSERMSLYKEYSDSLLGAGRAYRCYCTSDELDSRKKAVIEKGLPWRYDRRCANLSTDDINRFEEEGRPYAVRFRVPEGEVVIEDILRGEVKVDAKEIDDFIISRSTGKAGFHLAVVVDDMTMDISIVIRGDDHLTNAARHVLLFEAFGARTPRFLHHSLLMGPDGSKLSKRHGSTSVSDYRGQGYLPEALMNYLALLSWSPGDDREIFTPQELVKEFSIKGISASKAIFDFDKLNWLDRQHIKKLSSSELTDQVVPFIKNSGDGRLLGLERPKLELAVESVRNNMEKLTDGLEPLEVYVRPAGELSEKAGNELRKMNETGEALGLCIEVLRANPGTDLETAERIVEQMRSKAKEKEWGARKMLWPFRLAVTGLTIGPDLTHLIMFWEPEGCARRIEAVREKF
ncbi:MAG: glutamate--tRNA ligase [Actinobacteria bacterium]|nr:glutamate--tRNA ligase [Actinomycetota bacterium]